MPVLEDPNIVLPTKRKLTPSQLIMILLYPVVFLVGLAVGIIVGIRQGEQSAQANTNMPRVNSSVIPNANTRVNTNTVEANVNVDNVFNNVSLGNGDYLKLDAATQASLTSREQQDKSQLVDQSVSLTDIVRQQDLITLKYRILAYFAVNKSYPSTDGQLIKLDRGENDVLYQSLKDFYGGSFNEPIDPEYPTYYYGYTSDGVTFTLTGYLTTTKQPFKLTAE